MPDDALVFATDDSDFTNKLNKKTLVVGTGTQLNSLTTTYAGQVVYCTVTGSGFTADHRYMRNVANNVWTKITKALVESAEQSAGNTIAATTQDIANVKNYVFFTLPTTEKFYIITAMEWKTGAVVGSVKQMGVDVVDANPPVSPATQLVALSVEGGYGPINSIVRTDSITSEAIRGGTILGAWINQASAVDLKYDTGLANQNRQKVQTYTSQPPTQEVIAWTATTYQLYLKVYFRGYS